MAILLDLLSAKQVLYPNHNEKVLSKTGEFDQYFSLDVDSYLAKSAHTAQMESKK